MIAKLMDSPAALLIMSFILGVGIAAMLRPVCRDGTCVVIQGPPPKLLDGKVYVIGEKCHEYKAHAVDCTANATPTGDDSQHAAAPTGGFGSMFGGSAGSSNYSPVMGWLGLGK